MSPNNLPLQLSSFIGRTREIGAVKRLLSREAGEGEAGVRLVTLTGAGGCGKTRLALQVGASLADALLADAQTRDKGKPRPYPDGVWLVGLAALSDAALVPQAIASALGVREQPNQPLLESLAHYLRDKQLLLLLDNCEHLIEACAQLAEALLQSCAHLRILATSREALRIAGETIFLVPSLDSPDPSLLPPLEAPPTV